MTFVTFKRRLAAAVVVTAALALGAPGKSAADGFDQELFDRWVEARAGSGEPVYWYSVGTVKAFPSGEVLARMEGFDTARLYKPESSARKAMQLSRKIYVFRDPVTNALMTEHGGKPIAQVRFPYQLITYALKDDQLETYLEQGVGARLLKLGPSSGISATRLGATAVYSAPLFLDVKQPPEAKRQVFEHYDFFIQPPRDNPREQYQLSWIRYGDRAMFGDTPTVTHMVSWRVNRFEDLPASIREVVDNDGQLWRAAPKSLAEIRELQKEPAASAK